MSVQPVIQVTAVGSSPVLSAGLASLLAGYDDLRVIAVGVTSDQSPSVETDVTVIGLAGLDLATATRIVCRSRARPDTKLVAVIDRVNDMLLSWVVDARVDACLNLETVGTHDLVYAVRAVMAGQTIVPTELLSGLRERGHAMAPGRTLTPRQRDVLALLAQGHSNKSIATHLGIEVGTVRMYVSVILAKLGVTNRTEAAALTVQQGLLT